MPRLRHGAERGPLSMTDAVSRLHGPAFHRTACPLAWARPRNPICSPFVTAGWLSAGVPAKASAPPRGARGLPRRLPKSGGGGAARLTSAASTSREGERRKSPPGMAAERPNGGGGGGHLGVRTPRQRSSGRGGGDSRKANGCRLGSLGPQLNLGTSSGVGDLQAWPDSGGPATGSLAGAARTTPPRGEAGPPWRAPILARFNLGWTKPAPALSCIGARLWRRRRGRRRGPGAGNRRRPPR